MAENTSVMLAHCGSDLCFRSVNRAYADFYGLAHDRIEGRPILEVLGSEAWNAIRPWVERALAGEVVKFEIPVPYSGGLRSMQVHYVPERDGAGAVVGWFATIIETTERRAAERAVRESEERFRELANHIDQFAWTCDALGHATWYNARWYEYTGTTFEEMKDDGWKRVHHPEHIERVTAGLQKCMAAGEPWEDTFPLRARDGSWRWFLSRAVPIRDETGHVVRWFGTNTDVTELRNLHEALRDADRRKDDFLALLAHELRNPLAPVGSVVEYLGLHGPPELAWARDVIQRQMRLMARLIDDLMDVSRMTRDNLELKRETVNLAEIVANAVETNRLALETAGQELVLASPGDPLYVDADPLRLEQVFANLLSNAARYSERPGTITVLAVREGDQVEIRVRDQGRGISAEVLPRIFDPFVQTEDVRSRRAGGLGVGLSLVKKLVELHGGTVSATSAGAGLGSEFAVRLPLVAAPASVSGTVSIRRSEKGQGRVLIVDDNRDAAESASALLRTLGYETRAVFDGVAALSAIPEFRPALVLLDIGLPGMDGLEVARTIRASEEGRNVVLVAVTGWGQAEDLRRSEEAGFDRHLVKPVDPAVLTEVVAELAGSAPAIERPANDEGVRPQTAG